MSDTGTTLKATLRSDLTASMKARERLRSATLRMALSAVTTAEVAGDVAVELSDDEVLKVLAKEAKKRREAAAAYVGAGRTELAEQEEAELAILETYLPSQLDDGEVEALVRQAITETGATGLPQMGLVMKTVTPLVAGRADGARVSAVVRTLLQA